MRGFALVLKGGFAPDLPCTEQALFASGKPTKRERPNQKSEARQPPLTHGAFAGGHEASETAGGSQTKQGKVLL